jgi:hypothetical protein
LGAGWLSTADRDALDTPQAIARFTAVNLPIVGGIGAASAGLHLAILAAHGGGTIGAGPRAALYGGVSVYLLASAILPSRKLTWQARAARLTTALAAMGLVFMGAIVVPVYLVPALAAVLALGLIAEAWLRINAGVLPACGTRTGSGASVMPHWPPGRASDSQPPTFLTGANHDRRPGTPGHHCHPRRTRWDDAYQEPTPASVWRTLVGSTMVS